MSGMSRKERGYKVSEEIRQTSNKFIGRGEENFKNPPKSLEWCSFYNNGLPLVVDFCKEVQKALMQNGLSRSQTMALEPLKEASSEKFHNGYSQ